MPRTRTGIPLRSIPAGDGRIRRTLRAQENRRDNLSKNERGAGVQVLIVGSGKLASELLENLNSSSITKVLPWTQRDSSHEGKRIVVHAGSGREIDEVVSFCSRNHLVLIELSTSDNLDTAKIPFPIIICPNVNILMLRFMAMLQSQGHLFAQYNKTILESHQSTKKSEPGTAISIANSIGMKADQIISVRDPLVQERELGIPSEYLSRHAYHSIRITDGNATILFETKVLGQAPYSFGLAQVIEGIYQRELEPMKYDVLTLIHNGWI